MIEGILRTYLKNTIFEEVAMKVPPNMKVSVFAYFGLITPQTAAIALKYNKPTIILHLNGSHMKIY